MSNHLTSIAYKRRMGCRTRKAVMALLADKASDDGRGIWAAKQSIADELDITKRTVISAIQGMIADGLLIEVGQRRCATGHTIEYAIVVEALEALPLVDCWQRRADAKAKEAPLRGERASPVQALHRCSGDTGRGERASPVQALHRCSGDTGRGERASPKPPLEPIPLSPDGDSPPAADFSHDQGDQAGEVAGEVIGAADADVARPDGAPRSPANGKGRSTRLPVNWTPPPISDLPPLARSFAERWPDGAYAFVAEKFRLYWTSIGGREAQKSDWLATFANWIMRDDARVQRDAKAGVSFAAALAKEPLTEEQRTAIYAAPDAIAQQCAISARVHAALRATLGETTYRRLFSPVAILIDEREGSARIVARFRSMLDDIESGPHRLRLNVALRDAMGRKPTFIHFETESRKGRRT